MKKSFLKIIFFFLLFVILGYMLGWMDNGPRKVNVDELPSRLDE